MLCISDPSNTGESCCCGSPSCSEENSNASCCAVSPEPDMLLRRYAARGDSRSVQMLGFQAVI